MKQRMSARLAIAMRVLAARAFHAVPGTEPAVVNKCLEWADLLIAADKETRQ